MAAISVLVVEDDEATRDLLDMVLGQEPGVYYSIAAGGANAIAKLSDGPPDLILTDMSMPKVDGRDVIAFARGRYPGIPIIAYSANAAGPALDLDHDVGGQTVAFLRKPFDLVNLLDLMHEMASDQNWRDTAMRAG
jgi:two-component system capsular synthesis sensor histidine kinase RcsC